MSVKEPPPEVVAVLRRGFPRTTSIIHLDPPEHTAVRRKMNAAFGAERIAAILRFASDRPVQFRQVTLFRGPVSLDVAWDADQLGASASTRDGRNAAGQQLAAHVQVRVAPGPADDASREAPGAERVQVARATLTAVLLWVRRSASA
ncbi:hypothetical protein [Sorangium sp. So ce1000]|uniref:hypothetical protein n=1 Tax=Sorangium sp. So ce1000 TaxID=3133325 RepID=UPI003F617797